MIAIAAEGIRYGLQVQTKQIQHAKCDRMPLTPEFDKQLHLNTKTSSSSKPVIAKSNCPDLLHTSGEIQALLFLMIPSNLLGTRRK